jgi:hypothetical protein
MAKDIQALKAVSQNLMHSNISITDGIYGVLSNIDVRKRIFELCQEMGSEEHNEIGELISLTKSLLHRLAENNKGHA